MKTILLSKFTWCYKAWHEERSLASKLAVAGQVIYRRVGSAVRGMLDVAHALRTAWPDMDKGADMDITYKTNVPIAVD